jgi:hypothetical protein
MKARSGVMNGSTFITPLLFLVPTIFRLPDQLQYR